MLKNTQQQNLIEADFSINKGQAVDAIMAFLDQSLPAFKSDLSSRSLQEDDISQECNIYLNREAREHFFMFHFQYKYPEGKRSSDFSVISAERFSSKEPILILEAKRLPTPGSGRTREYVEGNLGGIERFKRSFHGKGLSKSVMLAYVQENDFDYWHQKITEWINYLIKNSIDVSIKWETKDLLQFIASIDQINKYHSHHSRLMEADIELFHYWIYTN